jgi:hypothetical protein
MQIFFFVDHAMDRSLGYTNLPLSKFAPGMKHLGAIMSSLIGWLFEPNMEWN